MNLTNKDENRLVLSDDGRLFRERTILEELALNEDEIFQDMREGMKLKMRDVMEVEGCPVHLCTNGKVDENGLVLTWATVELFKLRLNTSYTMDDGALVPEFKKRGQESDGSAPVMPLEWVVKQAAPRLSLWMLAQIFHNPMDAEPFELGASWLIATSASNRHYRLPLPNVHADCKICTGDFDKRGDTLEEVVQNDLRQFFASNWNSDLAPDMDNARKMFRFKPLNEGVETLPVSGQWNNFCQKVSIPQLDFMCLPRPSGGDE